jgi:ribosome-binding protein aMBF1 (putative translation factor)
MSNARLERSAEGTGAVSASAYQVVRLKQNPTLSLPHILARDALRKTFGADVRRERTARRISQDELARRCGLHPRTIVKIEAGEIGIRPETLDQIEGAIGCTFKNGAIEKPKLKGRERRR